MKYSCSGPTEGVTFFDVVFPNNLRSLSAWSVSYTHLPDKNAKRREKVLNNMKDQGYISKAQYDEAMADDVYSRIAEYNLSLIHI